MTDRERILIPEVINIYLQLTPERQELFIGLGKVLNIHSQLTPENQDRLLGIGQGLLLAGAMNEKRAKAK